MALSNRRRRGGYLYVAVLLTALVVSTMGLVALSAASLRMRAATDANDWATAQVLAQSAIEDGLLQIRDNANWRTLFLPGVEYPSPAVALGSGSFTWKLVDDDGNLADDDSDSVRIVGIGRVGTATAAGSARLLPTGRPLTCLESALHCQGDITLGPTVELATNQRVSSNGNVSANGFGASILGAAEATGNISGTVSGTKTQSVPARRMPGSSVFDYYLDNGTRIPLASLPVVNGAYNLENQLLSPQHNVSGGHNPEGIYVIDCGGQRVRIKNCRILGTIVLLNPAANSSLEGSLRWDAAVGNYPALLVSGSLELRTSTSDLSESAAGTNFNPLGLPYQGNEDIDLVDQYPSEVNGLIFVSGTLNLPSDFLGSVQRGSTVCNSIAANSDCWFNYRALLSASPPPGFSSGNPMVISPGSRRRETLP